MTTEKRHYTRFDYTPIVDQLRRLVDVTTGTQLVWLICLRTQPSHLPQQLCNQNDTQKTTKVSLERYLQYKFWNEIKKNFFVWIHLHWKYSIISSTTTLFESLPTKVNAKCLKGQTSPKQVTPPTWSPRGDAGGLSREYVLRIPSVS